ncbi:hypothetical protein DUI87_29761 [Hirundo rustica rustica]|uniref:Uncharacterized protein n=1 Tax=Hirundo rustica rustica TaxID=333673 RepID=A0A3M0J4S4_HIRRU|nr:hypothetical protein DUI87_29759 [Hirundo rustica rustica]RMB93768.1 hypothetical protein DUI87_29760 [Hirundo rustica rustica]RMB93769.1 hypothetical protein DUI87_29761 [Hirundo rustica rustica]
MAAEHASVYPGSLRGSMPRVSLSHKKKVDVWNPSFDVTPQELITGGIITECGVFGPSEVCRELAERGEP